MTPVIVLSDGHLSRASETWRVPDLHSLTPIKPSHDVVRIAPGTPGKERRLSGMEHDATTGEVDFDPANHERMVRARALKIARAADAVKPLEVVGPVAGELLVLGWGSTMGTITEAVERCRRRGIDVARAHLRHLLPMPTNTADVLRRYRRVLVPELNAGQLASVLRSQFSVEVVSLSKTQGRPFLSSEIETKIESLVQVKTA
jgi:2-oxoglutarate ferredoxin oxidoreductase subunit alpha